MEVWKEIDGYNQRYEVSNYGRVRSKDMVVNGRLQNCHKIKGRILKPHTDKEGYKGGFHSEPGQFAGNRPYRRQPSQ